MKWNVKIESDDCPYRLINPKSKIAKCGWLIDYYLQHGRLVEYKGDNDIHCEWLNCPKHH